MIYGPNAHFDILLNDISEMNCMICQIQSTPFITLKFGSIVVSALLKKHLIMFYNENN